MKVNNPTIKGEKVLARKKLLEVINEEITELMDSRNKINNLDKNIKKLLENTKSKYHK